MCHGSPAAANVAKRGAGLAGWPDFAKLSSPARLAGWLGKSAQFAPLSSSISLAKRGPTRQFRSDRPDPVRARSRVRACDRARSVRVHRWCSAKCCPEGLGRDVCDAEASVRGHRDDGEGVASGTEAEGLGVRWG